MRTCLQLFWTPILLHCIFWNSAHLPFDRYLIRPAANTAPIDCDIMLVKCLDACGSWSACRCLHVCVCSDFHVFMFMTLISCRVVTVDYLELRLGVIYQFPTWGEMESILQYLSYYNQNCVASTQRNGMWIPAKRSGHFFKLDVLGGFFENISHFHSSITCALRGW